MPGQFRKLGIAFQYPDNWQLDDSDALQGGKSVSVYAPDGGAFWTVAVHPRKLPPEKLAQAAMQAMKEEYDSLEAEEVREVVAGMELVGYDFNFYCFDLISTAAVRSVRTARATYTVFYQAEDREFAAVEHVFRAMLQSLLEGFGTDGGPKGG